MELFSRILRGISIATLAALLTSAHPADAKTKVGSKAVKCAHCAMPLSTKKTAATPIAVKVNGKTYYCCSNCGMSSHKHKSAKGAPAKATKAKTAKAIAKAAAPKPASIPLCPKCGMQMIASPTLLKKTPIVVNGKTYYCCTICPNH